MKGGGAPFTWGSNSPWEPSGSWGGPGAKAGAGGGKSGDSWASTSKGTSGSKGGDSWAATTKGAAEKGSSKGGDPWGIPNKSSDTWDAPSQSSDAWGASNKGSGSMRSDTPPASAWGSSSATGAAQASSSRGSDGWGASSRAPAVDRWGSSSTSGGDSWGTTNQETETTWDTSSGTQSAGSWGRESWEASASAEEATQAPAPEANTWSADSWGSAGEGSDVWRSSDDSSQGSVWTDAGSSQKWNEGSTYEDPSAWTAATPSPSTPRGVIPYAPPTPHAPPTQQAPPTAKVAPPASSWVHAVNKRAAEEPAGAPEKRPAPGAAFNVVSRASTADPGAQRLLGEYAEYGLSGDRKTYKRTQGPELYLYFWDEKDGPDYSGWWFGTQVGSGEFLARNTSNTQLPPKVGWQVPADKPAVINLLIVEPIDAGVLPVAASAPPVPKVASTPKPGMPAQPPKMNALMPTAKVLSVPMPQGFGQAMPAAKSSPKDAAPKQPAVAKPALKTPGREPGADGLKVVTGRVTLLETTSKRAMDDAKKAAAGPAAKVAEAALKKQQEEAFEVQKLVNQESSTAKGAGASTQTISAFSQLSARMRPILAGLVQEIKSLAPKLHQQQPKPAQPAVAAPKLNQNTPAPKLGQPVPKPVQSAPKPGQPAAKPGQPAAKPVQQAPKPGSVAPRPGVAAPKPGFAQPKLGIAVPKPVVAAPKPGIASAKPGIATPKPGQAAPKVGQDSSGPQKFGLVAPQIAAQKAAAKAATMTSEQASQQMPSQQMPKAKNSRAAPRPGQEGKTAPKTEPKATPNAEVAMTAKERVDAKKKAFAEQAEQRKAELEKKKKEKEAADSNTLKDVLVELKTKAAEAVAAVAAVKKVAAPILASVTAEIDDTRKEKTKEVEAEANKAQVAITEARKFIAQKQQAMNTYVATVREEGKKACEEQQTKLNDALKALTPLKRLQQELQAVPALQKALASLTEQVEKAEADAKEAVPTCDKLGRKKELTADEATMADKLLVKVETSVAAAQRSVDARLKGSTGLLMDDFKKLEARVKKMQEKVTKSASVLKPKLESMTPALIKSVGAELVEAAEKAMQGALDAEFPFMMGQEVLPPDEAKEAFEAIDAAAAEVSAALASAEAFIASKAASLKIFADKELARGARESLDEFKERLDPVTQRFSAYTKTTADRKANALVFEVSEMVDAAEEKTTAMGELVGVLTQESIEEVPLEKVKSVIEPAKQAEKEASEKLKEATAAVQQKQRSAKGAGDFAKVHMRLKSISDKLNTHRAAVSSSDRLMKSKEVYDEAKLKLKESEEEVERVEELASSDEELSDDVLEKLEAAMKSAQDAVMASTKTIQPQLGSAPPRMKTPLEKLLGKRKGLLAKLDAVRKSTRGQREQWLSREIVNAASEKVTAVERAVEEMEEAEHPFMKGLEVISSKEAEEAVKVCEEAIASVQKCSEDAKGFISSKTQDAKKFLDAVGKPLLEELGKFTSQINSGTSKVAKYKKDTEERKRTTFLQLAGEKLEAIEKELETAAETLEPLLEKDMDALSDASAKELAEELTTLKEEMLSKAEEFTKFVGQLTLVAKNDPTSKEKVEKVRSRLAKINTQSDSIAKQANTHMHNYLAKEMLKDVDEHTSIAEKKVAEVTEAAAPLLADKGDKFLFESQLQVCVSAMRELMKKDSLKADRFYTKVNSGKAITEAALVAYLKKLPDLVGRVDLEYTEDQRKAMFKVAAGGKDKIDKTRFVELFRQRYSCVKEVSITGAFDLGGDNDEPIERLEAGDVVEATGEAKKDEDADLIRVEVLAPSTKRKGWVSISGNKGTVFLEPYTAFTQFSKEMDEAFAEATQTMKDVDVFLKNKTAEFTTAKKNSSHAETKDEFNNAKKKTMSAMAALEPLRRKVMLSKKEYLNREKTDRRAQEELPEQRAADKIFGVAEGKATAVEASMRQLEEAVKPFTDASEEEALKSIEKPGTACRTAEKLTAEITRGVADAREAVKTQLEEAAKGTSRPMNELKQKLNRLKAKLEGSEKRCKIVVNTITAKCKSIALLWLKVIATAVRQDSTSQNGMGALFDKLAAGENAIADKPFGKYLKGLEDLDIPEEHIQLVYRQLAAGEEGVGRLSFLGLVQQYVECVKPIGVTDTYELQETKTLRRAEVGEVFEVLEGPRSDEGSGMSRVRCRAFGDGTVGWVSMTGSSGGVFLSITPKPCYKVIADVSLEKEPREGSEQVDELRTGDIFEMMEGPVEQETTSFRMQGRALSDGTTGWVTVSKQGDDKCQKVISPIVLTNVQDIKLYQPLRKLEIGELFMILEHPAQKEGEAIARMKVKALKDGLVGWLTPKGTKGTTYCEKSKNHWVALEAAPMTDSPQSGKGKTLRTIAKDEVLEIVKAPKEEGASIVKRVKGRSASGKVGWTSLRDNLLKKHELV